jgi:hypothetical protein
VVKSALFAIALVAAPAAADEGVCKVVDLDFQPQQLASAAPFKAPSQIVVWIEDTSGQYVDTIFITQQTGTYGLGNRPGRFDFNSGPKWPYGRRLNVFPVWAHRHGLQFDEVVFQNLDDSNLSHPFDQSSRENRFCRPIMPTEASWDAGSCPSVVFTDKGMLSTANKSLYPPRNDLQRATPDAPSVEMFQMLNPFDAVSQPTPANDTPAQLTWIAPDSLPDGNYVLWVEVSREFDHNTTYSAEARPSPAQIPWAEYGAPYRGQPSIVYSLPITISQTQRTVAHALDYAGYGDPDGLDGNLRVPDSTITTGLTGSGAERFAVRMDGSTPYRVRAQAFTEEDPIRPAAPATMKISDVTTQTAKLSFKAPGDDDFTGKVRRYEIRYVVGKHMDEAAFANGIELKPDLQIGEGGETVSFDIAGLLNGTEYTIGVRAFDDCLNKGALATKTFSTPERIEGEVDWCFVATAAYGSTMANDVEMLRRFRDFMLQSTVLGELAVEAYYTFGPALAGVVGESELLRATARAVLAPIVATVKVMRF